MKIKHIEFVSEITINTDIDNTHKKVCAHEIMDKWIKNHPEHIIQTPQYVVCSYVKANNVSVIRTSILLPYFVDANKYKIDFNKNPRYDGI